MPVLNLGYYFSITDVYKDWQCVVMTSSRHVTLLKTRQRSNIKFIVISSRKAVKTDSRGNGSI